MRSNSFVVICCLLVPLLFGAANVSGQSKNDRKQAEKLVKEADNAYKQRNYRLAIDTYAKALALDPTSANAHFFKGVAHSYLNEPDQALNEFDAALKQGYKRPVDVYLVRWRIYYAKKNYDLALADVQQGVQLDPQNTDFQLALADLSAAKGAYPDALAAYQKAAAKFPNNGDIYYGIARSMAGIGDSAGQLSAAQKAISLRTRYYGESLALEGDAHQKLGKQNEALDSYQKAIAAKPDIVEPYRNMGEIYRSQGRFNEAIDISLKGLKQFPNDGGIYTDLAWYYSLADKHEDAVLAAQNGIRLQPDQAMAYTNLCRAYNDLKRPELAVTACNNALKLSPNDGETLFYLGRAYYLAGRRAEAARSFKSAVAGLVDFTKKNPDYSDGFYLLGNAYFSDDQPQKAIEAYQKTLELSPRFAKARYNLAIIQNLQKNKPAAMEQYNFLVQIDPALAAKLKAELDKP
jgi:tetratricopeptide (TPR) repeat protein